MHITWLLALCMSQDRLPSAVKHTCAMLIYMHKQARAALGHVTAPRSAAQALCCAVCSFVRMHTLLPYMRACLHCQGCFVIGMDVISVLCTAWN